MPLILVYPLEYVPPQAGWVCQLSSRRSVAKLIYLSPQQARGPKTIQRTTASTQCTYLKYCSTYGFQPRACGSHCRDPAEQNQRKGPYSIYLQPEHKIKRINMKRIDKGIGLKA